jgi:hypothetical protein
MSEQIMTKPRGSERIISLDFLRGISIIAIIFLHVCFLLGNFFTQVVPHMLDPPITHIIFTMTFSVLMLLLGHLRGLFIFITCTVHIFSMTKSYVKGVKRGKILGKTLGFGGLLLLFSFFKEVFLNEWGFPRGLYLNGISQFQAFGSIGGWVNLYLSEALGNIAWAIIFTGIMFFFLSYKNGLKKVNRNSIITLILSLIFIFFSNWFINQVSIWTGLDFVNISVSNISSYSGIQYFYMIFVAQFFHTEAPVLVMASYIFMGQFVGIQISHRKPNRKWLKIGYWAFFGFFMAGFVWLFFVNGGKGDPVISFSGGFSFNFSVLMAATDFHAHPTWYILVAIGLVFLLLTASINMFEFRRKINLERALKLTRWIRRFGFLALTVYAFAAIHYLITYILSLIFTAAGSDVFPIGVLEQTPLPWAAFSAFITFLFWLGVLNLWALGKYKGSLEWFMVLIGKGKKRNRDDPLNMNGALLNPVPIMFTQPNKDQSIAYTLIGDPEVSPRT